MKLFLSTKMKRLAIATISCLMAVTVQAQFYVNGGYLRSRRFIKNETSLASLNAKQRSMKYDEDNNGFYIGASYNMHFKEKGYGLEIGLDYVHERNASYRYYYPPLNGQPAGGQQWDWKSIDIPMLFNIGTDLTNQFRLKGFVGPTFVYRFSYEGNDELYREYYSNAVQSVNIFATLGTSLEWNKLLRLKIGMDYCPFDMSVDGFGPLENTFGPLEKTYLTEWRVTVGLSVILPETKK